MDARIKDTQLLSHTHTQELPDTWDLLSLSVVLITLCFTTSLFTS